MTIEELNNKITLLENELESIKQERDRLSEPTFERRIGERYYYLRGIYHWYSNIDRLDHDDNTWNYENNNYFHTEQRAQEVIDKINYLLKLERLHDTYCPDYIPDWGDEDERKYLITYDILYGEYKYINTQILRLTADVYFPSEEIAQKVCGVLNAELRGGYVDDEP